MSNLFATIFEKNSNDVVDISEFEKLIYKRMCANKALENNTPTISNKNQSPLNTSLVAGFAVGAGATLTLVGIYSYFFRR